MKQQMPLASVVRKYLETTTRLASTIETAECYGMYGANIEEMNRMLLESMEEIIEIQRKKEARKKHKRKAASAATLATNEKPANQN